METPNLKITALHYLEKDKKYGAPTIVTARVQIESLEKLYFLLMDEADKGGIIRDIKMPDGITMEDGSVLDFNIYCFNAAFAKGRISETELYNMMVKDVEAGCNATV